MALRYFLFSGLFILKHKILLREYYKWVLFQNKKTPPMRRQGSKERRPVLCLPANLYFIGIF